VKNNLSYLWAQIEFYRSTADSLMREAKIRGVAGVEVVLSEHYRTAADDLELRVRRLTGDESEPDEVPLRIPEGTLRIDVPDFAKESNPPPVSAVPPWPREQVDVPGFEQHKDAAAPWVSSWPDVSQSLADRMEAYRLSDDALMLAAAWLRSMADRDGHHVTRKQAKKCRGVASRCETAVVSLRKAGEL
jgi:hypothetical protein